MNSVLMMLNIAGVFLIVIAVILQLPWRKWLYNKYGDNPLKARIYVAVGNKEFPVNGELKKANKDGLVYEYKWEKKLRAVALPKDYSVVFIAGTGRRKIRVIAGQLTASPMDGSNSETFGQTEYDTLIRSGIAVDVVNSLTGKKAVNWLIMIIIIAVAVGGYLVFKNMNKPAEIGPTPTSNQSMPIYPEYPIVPQIEWR
jgi:hypothetical protein